MLGQETKTTALPACRTASPEGKKMELRFNDLFTTCLSGFGQLKETSPSPMFSNLSV